MKTNIKNILSLLLVTISISSCQTFQQVNESNELSDDFKSGRTAIVIIQNANCIDGLKTRHTASVCKTNFRDHSSSWENTSNGKILVANPRLTLKTGLLGLNQHLSIAAEKNRYDLDTMIFEIDPGTYTLISTNSSPDKIKDLIEFHVNGGEVAYLGKLAYHHGFKIMPLTLDIEDEFSNTNSYINDNFKYLKGRVKKRLMYFTPRALEFRNAIGTSTSN